MDWTSRIRAAFDDTPIAPDVVEELADHARALYEAARADGLPHDEADRRVTDHVTRWRADASSLRRMAGRTPMPVAPAPSASWIAGARQDLHYAARLLRRQPRHALLVIATMAIGIAAATTLFSVAYGVLVRPLPWPHADRIVEVRETRGGRQPRFGAVSNAAFLAWKEQATTIERLAAWSQRTVTLGVGGEPERVRLTAASADIFATLGVTPLIGALFDDKDATSPVIVLAERFWRRRFSADISIIGRSIDVDGRPHTIVGVVPGEVAFPDQQSQGWIPIHVSPVTGSSLSMFNAVALLRPGMTPEQAAAEGTARGQFVPDTGMTTNAIFGGTGPVAIAVTPVAERMTADVRRPLLVLLGAVGLLLVAATANVASLQLARASARSRELAIRAAIGADSNRIARQLLTESLLLGIAGGAAGTSLAALIHRALPSLLPADFPRVAEVTLDPTVLVFALGLSVASGVAFGVLPALRLRRQSLLIPLTDGGTTPVGVNVRHRTARLRLLIMTGQIAVTSVLLVGASLLGRSFWALVHVDRGYDPSGVVTATVSLPNDRYPAERRYEIVERILDRLSTGSRSASAAFTSELPLTAGGSTAAFTLRSAILEGPTTVQASPRMVSADYFSVMRMTMAAGRTFLPTDGPSSEPVAIVNRAFARQYLGEQPLGARVPMGVGYMPFGTEASVVGVVDDVRYVASGDAIQPEIYYVYRQLQHRVVAPVATFLVRDAAFPDEMAGATLRRAIREADRGLVPDRIATLETRVGAIVARPRLYAVLLGTFAAFALGIAAVGLFGVLSYTVAQRSRELAVRAAIGAHPAALVRLVLRQGLAIVLAGLGIGLFASLGLASSLRALLYGVTTHDAFTFTVVPLVVLSVAVVACLGPALRAGRVDPIRELRS